jgi:Mrp family chromosome partitioning ATPase
MAPAVDGVVVMTLAGQTNRKVVAAVMAMLQRVQANVLGVVLNEVTKSTSDGYGITCITRNTGSITGTMRQRRRISSVAICSWVVSTPSANGIEGTYWHRAPVLP